MNDYRDTQHERQRSWKRLILTLFAAGMNIMGLIPAFLFAQQSIPGLDNVIPPSPTAASLGKFADIPVSLYTGTPNISVPLWTCQGDALTLPVSLSYHASGLKVDEIPGWTGTGWTLNAGGAITRATRGIADDLPTGYLDLGRTYLPPLDEDLTPLATWSPPGQSPSEKYEFLQQVSSGQVDLEPDIFYYNFNGHSGKFMFGQDGTIILIPAADIKINYKRNPVTQAIEQWIVRDVSGIRYTFGTDAANEITTPVEPNGSPGKSFISAWYLIKMESPNGEDQISFSYADYQNVYRYPVPLKKTGCNEPSREDLFQYTQTRINGKYLSRIEYLRGTVVFDTVNMGSFPGGNITALKLIKILFPGSNTIFKSFDLEYSFFPATGCGTEQDYLPPCKRLRLDKVTEYSGDFSNHKPSWQFFYDDQPLPPRGSFSQDYWGFYNGKPNEHNIPALRVFNYTDRSAMPPRFNEEGRTAFEQLVQRNLNIRNLEYYAWDIPGADRSPDSTAMQAGILRKIVYPTGGATMIEYEPHTFGYFTRPAIKDLIMATAYNPVAKDVIKSFHLNHDQFVTVVPLFYNFKRKSKGGLKSWFSLEVHIPTGIPIDNGDPSPECRVQILPADAQINPNNYFELSWADALDSTSGFEADYRVWLKKGDYKILAHAPAYGDSVIARLSLDTSDVGDKVYPVYGNDYQATRIQAGMVWFIDDSSYAETKTFTLTQEDDPLVSLNCYFHSKIHPNRITTVGLPYPVTSVRLTKIPENTDVFEKVYYDIYQDSIQWDDKNKEWYFSTGDKIILEPGTYELSFLPRISTEYGMVRLTYRKSVATHSWVMGGGLRVRKMVETSHGNDTIGIREYRYEMEAGDTMQSSGVLMNLPRYDEVLTPLYYYPKEYGVMHYWCLPVNVFSTGKNTLGSTSGSPVGYAKVSVIEPGNGRTVYEYTSPLDVPDISSMHFPYVPVIGYDWQRGLLRKKTVLDDNNRIRLVETTSYHLPGTGKDSLFFTRIPAVKVTSKMPGQVYSNIWDIYYTQAGWSYPEKKTTTYYGRDNSPPLVTEEEYKYSPNNLMVTETETRNSDGTRQKTKTLYSADITGTDAVADTMHARNMDNIVIRTEVHHDSLQVDGTRNYYGLYYNNSMVLKDSVMIFTGDTFRTQVVFDRYDNRGHILQAHRPGGTYQSFHWNEYGFPIARIMNATYRDALSAYPGDAQRTRYTWDIMSGMTSMTDPNNRKTTYAYDGYGRLETIRDPGNRITKQATYHYQKYEGDTTRKYFEPEAHIWSTAPDAILTTDTPLVQTCTAHLTVSGGSLGTDAEWRWYKNACGDVFLGTGSSLDYSPQSETMVFVRAEGRINTTRCASVRIRVLDPGFEPESDTLRIPPEGTTAHPLLFLHGYSGCDPVVIQSKDGWFGVSGENNDNLSVTAGENNTGNVRTGTITLTAAGGTIAIPVVQEPIPELTVNVSWIPAFIQPGDVVTLTATVEGGSAPYDYIWEKKSDNETSWTLLEKHFSQNLPTDHTSLTAGSSNFDVRCRVTSGGKTTETIVHVIVAQ